MKRCWCYLLPVVLCLSVLLVSCQTCPLNESISIASSQGSLTIDGTGFSTNTNSCARLGFIGLPSGPKNVSIGTVNNCSGGAFHITYPLHYTPGCNPSAFQSIDVSASDTVQQGCFTVANTSIFWGDNCALQGTCGQAGQPACPGPTACYISGGVDAYGNCILPCGGQGNPPCTTTGCNHALLPQYGPSVSPQGLLQPPIVCTAYCGYAQGAQEPCSILGPPDCQGGPPTLMQPQSPCITQTTVAGQPNPINVYTCNGDSVTGTSATIGQGCLCLPAPGLLLCQGSSSALSGLCMPVQSVDQNCTQ